MLKSKVNFNNLTVQDLVLIFYILCITNFSNGDSLVQIARVLIFLCAGFSLARHRIKANKYLWWYLILTSWSLCTAFWAWDTAVSISMTKTMLINSICCMSVFYLIRNDEHRQDLTLRTFCVAPILIAGRVFLIGGFNVFMGTRWFMGISANSVGIAAAIGFIIALSMFKQYYKQIDLIILILNFLAVVLSGSRKSLMIVVLAIIIIQINSYRDKFGSLIIQFTFGLLLVVFIYWLVINNELLYDVLGSRIETLLNKFLGNGNYVDSSANTRANLVQWGIQWFSNNPWIGYGADNYRIVLTTYHPDYPLSYYAHNNFVEVLVDFGLLGFTGYYYMYFNHIISFIFSRNVTHIRVLCFTIILTILIAEYGLVDYYDIYIQTILIVAFSVLDYTNIESVK